MSIVSGVKNCYTTGNEQPVAQRLFTDIREDWHEKE